ncbi:hypothetical protein TraAM80_01523 [Trypanosoma rangeli]|uniref:Uncharacterized protein n=1 Tax=Trypanosoma rangeli TaxID=5698 RepID=A0A3R7KMN8_TRYRA|nr:uncharacterized protein TraAM80_01523 [Trypanosoma rangeli]RNF10477.1 hypothetical protein TraAM80_01523 [Trypanosoma rangeli]|eukprot:RNF10477.1 hypothetical protein TraAM80_01523 [Trypanosoma rangeli]
MRGALVCRSSSGGKCVGDVLDAIIDKAGVCGNDDKEKRHMRGKEEGGTYRKHRNRPPQGITAAVVRGCNPFFVSLRPEMMKTRKKKQQQQKATGGTHVKEEVTRTRGAAPKKEKRRAPKHAVAGCGSDQKLQTPLTAKTMQSCVSSVPAALGTSSANSPPPCHVRRLTARKLRSLSKGVTKATALFKLFKTLSLEGQSRLVKSRRRRCCRSVGAGQKSDEVEACLNAALWTALASVLQQRRRYKKQWHALWETHSDGHCDAQQLQLLRAFPLFGLLVVVERWRWKRNGGASSCSAIPEVVSSALGVVMHESSAFMGVALLRGEGELRALFHSPLRGEGLGGTTAEDALEGDEAPPMCRILRVPKMFPGGTGTAAELGCPLDATYCTVARVAPQEVGDGVAAFSLLVGRYL